MHPVTSLVCFGVRQVLGVDVADVAAAVEQQFTDHSQALPRALATANDKAWKALGVSLAGDSLFDKAKIWLVASGDEKGFREQVTRFLAVKGVSFDGSPAEFRKACLADLNRAFKGKRLSLLAGSLPEQQDVARQAATFQRYTDPTSLVKGAYEAVKRVAEALKPEFPDLAKLLAQEVQGGPPLLASAFSFFLRREVNKDEELRDSLLLGGLESLSSAQSKTFADVDKALTSLGERFDEALRQIEVVVIETRDAVLDVQAELGRLGSMHLANMEEIRRLFGETRAHLDRAGMKSGEVRPQDSLSIRGDDERRAVKELLARVRRLPEADRRQLPALVNGVGKVLIGSGDFARARETFDEVGRTVTDPAAKAEACYNAYLAALEEGKWADGLNALRQAMTLDRERFQAFPMERYQPISILGSGGFGTVFHCQDGWMQDRSVAIKTLHATDLARSMGDVFKEAHALMEVNDPTIIGILDVGFGDRVNRLRPYLVMHYFPGTSLERFLRERGRLPVDQLLVVARKSPRG